MRFQIGDYVTPVSNLCSRLNGGIHKFRGHVGLIVGYRSDISKYQVDFVDDMGNLGPYLHECGSLLKKPTGQNIAECDLKLVCPAYEDESIVEPLLDTEFESLI